MRTDASQSMGDGVTADQDPPNTTLGGRWLLAARAGWVTVATLTLGLVAVGFAVALDRPDLMRRPSGRAILADAGLPDPVTNIALFIGLAVLAGTGLLIFWRRSDDRGAMLFALVPVTACAITVRIEWAPERAVPRLELPVRLLYLLATFLITIVFFVFPDGRFVPRWTRLLGVAAVPATVLLAENFPILILQRPDVSPGVARTRIGLWLLVQLVLLGIGLYAQVYRYRHVSGAIQRQQTKWVALILWVVLLVALLGVCIPMLFLDMSSTWFVWIASAVLTLSFLGPVSVAVAILRHRLYDIDRLISRTLTYGLLTVMLVAVYAVAVVLLGQALNPRGGNSAFAVAASTLFVAALFQPLRRRIQDKVDRRFNRRRYHAAKTIEAFSARLREQIDLDTLSAELLSVVDQTMQPTKASLWLRPPTKSSQDHADSASRSTGASRSGRRVL